MLKKYFLEKLLYLNEICIKGMGNLGDILREYYNNVTTE